MDNPNARSGSFNASFLGIIGMIFVSRAIVTKDELPTQSSFCKPGMSLGRLILKNCEDSEFV